MNGPTRGHVEGPDLDREIRIIGVELTAQIGYSGIREELQMFATERTLPYEPHLGLRPVLTVTIHTSHGDRQGTIQL